MVKIDLDLLSAMTSTATRALSSQSLAQSLGAQDLIVFDFDNEVQRFLPSLGFPQTLRDNKSWQALLKDCSIHGNAKATLAFPPSHNLVAVNALKFDELVWVFSAEHIHTVGILEDLQRLDNNFARVLKAERYAIRQEGHNQVLREVTSELQSYANALNTTKSELNRALQATEEARTMAEQANATKSAFLANMSHEIRTPLNAILGYSSLLRDTALTSEERLSFISTIERNGKGLIRIIDDILDLAKVEAGKIDIEYTEFSLYDLINEAVDLFRDIAQRKNISLSLSYEPSIPRSIYSDPSRLRQIVINIIGNAVKFTSQGGVEISVGGLGDTETANSYLFQIKVKDSGPGLNQEQKERIFQPFMQADNSITRRFGGTGLGLVLSKRLAEALCGSIDITQFDLGKGCTFVVTFPARYSDVSTKTTSASSNSIQLITRSIDKVRVLLVDDAIDNLRLAKRLLERNGALVDTASDGIDAIEKAMGGTYDIILMDIQMPTMDGYEAMAILRARGCQLPILALTAHAMLEERAKSIAAGFNGHLSKPFNLDELVQAIRTHVT